jgi:valyl-tRNA synthetase
MQLEGCTGLTVQDCSMPLDLAQIDELRETTRLATAAFEQLDYATALDKIETSFWMFCDHYIELVKTRAYRDENETHRRSAQATLEYSLKTYLRLFAPFLPFVTEEIWSWHFSSGKDSIHRAPWPSAIEIQPVAKPPFENLLEMAITITSSVRGAKTQAQKNMKHPVTTLTLNCSEQTRCKLETVLGDILLAGSIEHVVYTTREDNTIVVESVVLGE